MEVDFNGVNNQIYGIQMLANAHKYNPMSKEIYSKCNRIADNGTLTKVIAYDIIWQT